LHPFSEIEAVFSELEQLGVPTTAYCPGTQFAPGALPKNVTIAKTPINLGAALRNCEFAILNATHGATASALLAGRPIFQIPLHHEQQLIAMRSMSTGATLAARSNSATNLRMRLRQFLANSQLQVCAADFRERHRAYSLADSMQRATYRVEQVLAHAA
jgi:UDP:flavonoid glycosyltransferase YjiC (YdhE family)